MKIAIIGAGYVGLVIGACLADHGNEVICVDKNKQKIEKLNENIVPIYEPGLEDLIKRNRKENRLNFTIDIKRAIESSEIIFISVDTPAKINGDADLTNVFSVAKEIGKYMNDYKIIISKSTVPVGTIEKVKKVIKENQKNEIAFDITSNPEFLSAGKAVQNFLNPDRIVIGIEDSPVNRESIQNMINGLYKPLERVNQPIIITDIKSAELAKYASNSFLATKISFINELSHLCEKVGANIKEIAKIMGYDKRIGSKFLHAGVGYGGSCFPKDVKALAQTLEKYNLNSDLLRAVDYVNERQKKTLIPKLKEFLPSLNKKLIAVWGLSFKPKTDDIREAPALTIIEQLKEEEAKISAYDPEAIENVKKLFPDIKFTKNPYEAIDGADALIIITEWDVFRELDKNKIKTLLKQPIIIDGRNIYDPKEMKELGFKYRGVGR